MLVKCQKIVTYYLNGPLFLTPMLCIVSKDIFFKKMRWGTSFEMTRVEIIFFVLTLHSKISNKILILIFGLITPKFGTFDLDPCNFET